MIHHFGGLGNILQTASKFQLYSNAMLEGTHVVTLQKVLGTCIYY